MSLRGFRLRTCRRVSRVRARNRDELDDRMAAHSWRVTPPHPPPELEENSPRYVALDFELKHADGRTSFPLVLVYWCPQTSSTQLSTLYTSALSNLAVQADIGRVVDMRDGVLDGELLQKKLGGA